MIAGIKHDTGKPYTATVLAGFWPVLGAELTAHFVATLRCDASEWQGILDALFDARLDVNTRLTHARDALSLRYALDDVIAVGTFGARKYARGNWRHVDDGVHRYYEAAGRHFLSIARGRQHDAESGLPELGHFVWNIYAGATLATLQAKEGET